MITQDQVKDLFDYRDGELYWKISVAHRKAKIGDKAGGVNSKGYLLTRINGVKYYNHRIIFLWHYGWVPEKIDHKDTNPSNNKIDNLRPATSFENGWNMRISKKNTSSVKGVGWDKRVKKWHVRIRFNHKLNSFGLYHDIEVAKFIAETMRYKYHGKFANHGEKTN